MKYCLIFILLQSSCFGQVQLDTFQVQKVNFNMCYRTSYSLTQSDGKYYLNSIEISKTKYLTLNHQIDSICTDLDLRMEKYCQVYDKGILIEEGIIHPEFFTGYYKKYYPNGKLEREGYLTDDIKGVIPGKPIGKWIYYNKKGQVRKVKNYSARLSVDSGN